MAAGKIRFPLQSGRRRRGLREAFSNHAPNDALPSIATDLFFPAEGGSTVLPSVLTASFSAVGASPAGSSRSSVTPLAGGLTLVNPTGSGSSSSQVSALPGSFSVVSPEKSGGSVVSVEALLLLLAVGPDTDPEHGDASVDLASLAGDFAVVGPVATGGVETPPEVPTNTSSHGPSRRRKIRRETGWAMYTPAVAASFSAPKAVARAIAPIPPPALDGWAFGRAVPIQTSLGRTRCRGIQNPTEDELMEMLDLLDLVE